MRRMTGAAAALTLATGVAAAQESFYYAERAPWTVTRLPASCVALNRPAADFNASPYNALDIKVRPGQSIAVGVYYWPGAFFADHEYQLQLVFDGGGEPLTLPATAFSDYGLASAPDMGLWRRLQASRRVTATVIGEPVLALHFGLEDMDWVLNRALQACARLLPKE